MKTFKTLALDLRKSIVNGNDIWIRGLSEEEERAVMFQVKGELEDDPSWSHRGRWQWKKYQEHAEKPNVFGTYFNLAGFVRQEGFGVTVLQRQGADGSLQEVWTDLPASGGGYDPILVVRARNHYDLFVRQPPSMEASSARRMVGKRPVERMVETAAAKPSAKKIARKS